MAFSVIDPKEKERLLRTFADNIHKSSLREFSKKHGYGDGYLRILFKEDLEEDEYKYLQESTEIKENQVLLNAIPPAAPKEENLYLDFDEFYAYLATEVYKRIQVEPAEEKEYLKLLVVIRDTLGLQEMIPTVTDPEEKEILLRTFANNIDKRCLRKFAKKQGYGDEYIIILFKEDLEEDEYAFLQELTEIKEDQVLLTAGFTEEENLYLDFDEFYAYLATEVEKRIQAEPAEEKEYLKLLAAVRDTLGLQKVVPTVIEPKGKERLLRTFESNIHKLLVGVKKFWN